MNIIPIVLFVIGLFLLIKGGDWFVDGATGIALMPVVYSYCTSMNVPPELAIIMVVMGVHIAFLTPAASASASLLHGNEWSNAKAIWRTVPIVILATWATISAIVVALGVALF